MKNKKSVNINYTIPGEAMHQQEFKEMIKKAEKGLFYTIEEIKVKLLKPKSKPTT